MTLRDTGSTDHVAFDEVGLPGFQFIQDQMDYFYAHPPHGPGHVRPRPGAGPEQASVLMAAFLYDAAMRPEPLPRKPLPREPKKEVKEVKKEVTP